MINYGRHLSKLLLIFPLSLGFCSCTPDRDRLPVHSLSNVKSQIHGIDWDRAVLISKGINSGEVHWLAVKCDSIDISQLGNPEIIISSNTTIERIHKISSYRFSKAGASASNYRIRSPDIGDINIYIVSDVNGFVVDCMFNPVRDQ